jgi:endonuclease/exonuclease/phosphatase family metal-dependent hydrolase
MFRRSAAMVALAALLLAACSVRRAPDGLPRQAACTTAETTPNVRAGDVRWVLRAERAERSALDAWCWAVGPAVWSDHRVAGASAAADSIAIVTWNAEVGHGRLDRLIGDLRSGALTGAPVRHFVLLLQEVHRAGSSVPESPPEWSAVPRAVGDLADPARFDIVEFARRERLTLFYAPSMRNGRTSGNALPEDRGNAILSTLPLSDPTVLELPYERQRRVAVLASVRVLDAALRPVTLRLASVHLDNRARLGTLHRTLGEARANQASVLAREVADGGPAIVGGDLNTWVPIADEAAVNVLRAELPLPEDPPHEGTLDLPSVLPRLRLDHLFFRLPDGWDAGYRVAGSTYGSDHHPLVGWVRAGSADAVTSLGGPESK